MGSTRWGRSAQGVCGFSCLGNNCQGRCLIEIGLSMERREDQAPTANAVKRRACGDHATNCAADSGNRLRRTVQSGRRQCVQRISDRRIKVAPAAGQTMHDQCGLQCLEILQAGCDLDLPDGGGRVAAAYQYEYFFRPGVAAGHGLSPAGFQGPTVAGATIAHEKNFCTCHRRQKSGPHS
jgi:hypothetical protein